MGIFFYKLNSPYPEDVTKNCRLTVNEIDSNFLNLKDEDIKDVEFDCEAKTITLVKNNGDKLPSVDLTCALSGMVKNFDVKFENESGTTDSAVLKFIWEEDGKKCESTIKGLIRKDEDGNYIITNVFTDDSIVGNGRNAKPIGINPAEKTGYYKPLKGLVDTLPNVAKAGDRYLVLEHFSHYGRLYTIEGAKEIESKLSCGWRIPTKEDWDSMLNSIEPCENRNHNSMVCHTQLGKLAGKELKAKNWPDDKNVWITTDDLDLTNPKRKSINPKGSDNYCFSVFPGGFAFEKEGEIQKFGKLASFWTSTQIMPENDGDYFAKTFNYNMSGVWQSAECPFDFRSIRLVKDYNGSNYRGVSYILGKYYKEVLMPNNSIWIKENLDADTENLSEQLQYSDSSKTECDSAYVINEWDGKNWKRKIVPEGSVVVLENQGEYVEYRVVKDGKNNVKLLPVDDTIYNRLIEHFNEIINSINTNLSAETENRISADTALSAAIDTEREERVSGDTTLSGAIQDETSRAISAETDLQSQISAISEANNALSAAIDTEREERVSGDTILSGAIQDETSRAISAETTLSAAIDTEVERAISAETALSAAIDTEREERISGDSALSGAIQEENSRAIAREDEIEGEIPQGSKYTFSTIETLVIPSKTDGSNNIEITFDGNFGEF